MPIMIRAARADDGPTFRDIERHAGERFRTVGLDTVADDEPLSLDVLAAYAAAGRSWVAADDNDVPVGYVVVDEVDANTHIEQVSVRPDHQGTGVGRHLIERARAWGADTGRWTVTLTTYADVPWNAPLYKHLGFAVMSERAIGPQLQARRDAEAAGGLDPARRVCMRLSPPSIEPLVADALDGIPEALGRRMENVAVTVADWPTAAQLGGRRGTLLGLYEGVALTRRSPLSYAATMPDRITIFEGPLRRLARDQTDLVRLVHTTVIHEVAHHFGISDARLEELGWA